MKNLVLIILAVAIALGIQNYVLPKNGGDSSKAETTYERVIRTNTLRCAYAIYPPFLSKDPNSGKLSGIAPDLMAAFEKTSGLKVEWGPEIDWGNIGVTLQSDKADAFCAGMFLTPKRGHVIAGSTPIFFSTMEAFVRQDDKRFDNNIDRINQPDVRISVNLGDISEELAQRSFPQAQRVYKGELGGESALFLNVATNKADIALSGPSNLSTYNQSNPATALRKVTLPHPLIGFASVIGVSVQEPALLQVINASLHDMIDNGVVERILKSNLGAEYGTAYFPPKPQLN